MGWLTGILKLLGGGMDFLNKWFAKKERKEIENTGRELQNSAARQEVLKTHVEVNKREEDVARASDSELDSRLSKFKRQPAPGPGVNGDNGT